MEKIKTSSYFVVICKFGKKIFVQRRKRKGLHAYPRTLTLKEINKYLKATDIKYPKLLINTFKYVYEEFIISSKSIDSLSNLEIMDKVISIINILDKISVKNRKIKWSNNSEFLKYNIDNLKKVLIYKYKNLTELDEYLLDLDCLYNDLDDNRKLHFLHGDIHRKNMIISNDDFYLIDWELATYGDLAYELATHFILMNYTEKEKNIFLNKLNNYVECDINNLKNDIDVYINFELYKRKLISKIRK